MKNTLDISRLGLLLLVSAAIFFSCKTKETATEEENNNTDTTVQSAYAPQQVEIKGYVKGGANLSLTFDDLTSIGELKPLLSVVVDESDHFVINCQIPEPGIYQLRFSPDQTIHLFLRGGLITLNTDIQSIADYEVIGSPESEDLRQMYKILVKHNNMILDMQDRMETLKKDKKRVKELLSFLDSQTIYNKQIAESKSKDLRAFITKIDTSMVALLAAFYLNPDFDYDLMAEINKKFASICPGSSIYRRFRDKMEKIIPVTPGYPAPDFTMPDLYKKNVSLSDFKGKPLLLYFWASNSEYSRKENKGINEVFKKYRDKGFKILAVSLDTDHSFWQSAVTNDEIAGWTHVSNLFGWDDEITRIYRVNDIPYLILIDKKGVIQARGFRVFELEKRLIPLL